MTHRKRYWAARGGVLIFLAAVIGAGTVAAADAYQRHKRQIAITKLIEESCDSCTLRHAAQLRLREILRQQREEAARAAGTGATSP